MVGKKPKVFVGLSGGVDSAVSAALLQKEGYEVVGAFIHIALPGYPCPVALDRQDAMRVAAHLGIGFREINLSKAYEERVLAHTLSEFKRGRTPNPDTLCNREIKFGLFYDWAMGEGADFVATGHYVQVKNGELYESVDPDKDQSYFLWMVPHTHLQKTLFPIGGMKKTEVRTLAKKFKLPNAERKDSQGLCFLGDLSLGDVVARELSPEPGVVLDEVGVAIGVHQGSMRYTLGQRHGFTITKNSPTASPHYVVAKDATQNTITVSQSLTPTGATKTTLELEETNWIGMVADGPCVVRYRYHQTPIPAVLYKEGNRVVLDEARYVPLGQSLVVYHGTRCLGGGIIARASLA